MNFGLLFLCVQMNMCIEKRRIDSYLLSSGCPCFTLCIYRYFYVVSSLYTIHAFILCYALVCMPLNNIGCFPFTCVLTAWRPRKVCEMLLETLLNVRYARKQWSIPEYSHAFTRSASNVWISCGKTNNRVSKFLVQCAELRL